MDETDAAIVSTAGHDRGADAALRESEARYRALALASADVVYRMGPDWSEMRQLEGHGFLSDVSAPTERWLTRFIPPTTSRP